jgi:hypothetical protein
MSGDNKEADALQAQIDQNNAQLEQKRQDLANTRMQIIQDAASGGWSTYAQQNNIPTQGTSNGNAAS